ncbi:hypothetical protein VNO77_36451 [Canavalia gladiata]|uniref:Uncharacterized protein n=1 Tax=Canavalia gladiata TaxID=3824 RepID=A0AAN9PVN7_CANGL
MRGGYNLNRRVHLKRVARVRVWFVLLFFFPWRVFDPSSWQLLRKSVKTQRAYPARKERTHARAHSLSDSVTRLLLLSLFKLKPLHLLLRHTIAFFFLNVF